MNHRVTTATECCELDCTRIFPQWAGYPVGDGKRLHCRCCHEKRVMRETRTLTGLNQGGGYEMDRKPPTKKRGVK